MNELSTTDLSQLHNSLIEKQFDLLMSFGIYETTDDAYLKLPPFEQQEYLNIRKEIDIVQLKMIQKFIPQSNKSSSNIQLENS